jgi:cobalamin biosynthesis protein CobT
MMCEIIQNGMTLRDWFAGQALQGWLASFAPDENPKSKDLAKFAYELADAILAEREKEVADGKEK